MKHTIVKISLFVLFCFAFAAGPATAQTGNVTFSARNLTVKEAFSEITRQAGYLFAFNHTVLDDSKVVVLTKQNFTVADALNELLKGTNAAYEVKGSHIVIVARPVQPSRPSRQPAAPARRTGSEWDWDWTSAQTKPVQQRRETAEVVEDIVKETVVVEKAEKTVAATVEQPATISEPVVTLYTQSEASSAPAERLPRPRAAKTAGRPSGAVSLKTNLLYGAATFTPNMSVEIGLGGKTTLDLWGSIHPWTLDASPTEPKSFEHWAVRPELRLWLRERSSGHFFGIHGFYSEYDVVGVGLPKIFDKEYRYEGNLYGGGITYGYRLRIGRCWGVEFSLSGGAGQFEYDKFVRGTDPAENAGKFTKTYVGPTGAGIKMVFIIH